MTFRKDDEIGRFAAVYIFCLIIGGIIGGLEFLWQHIK